MLFIFGEQEQTIRSLKY